MKEKKPICSVADHEDWFRRSVGEPLSKKRGDKMKPWKPILTTRCRKCRKDFPKDGLPYCLKCRVEMSERIMASTTIKDSDITKKVSYHKNDNIIRKLISWFRLAINFINHLKNALRKRRERREEERDNEILINKAGARE